LVDSMETLLTKEYRDEFYENGIDSNNQFEWTDTQVGGEILRKSLKEYV
jgi:hypothetical protein